jgi:hypothetical protein
MGFLGANFNMLKGRGRIGSLALQRQHRAFSWQSVPDFLGCESDEQNKVLKYRNNTQTPDGSSAERVLKTDATFVASLRSPISSGVR